MIDELLLWGGRLFKLLPQIMGLWEAAKKPDQRERREAEMALTRAVEDLQAREELGS